MENKEALIKRLRTQRQEGRPLLAERVELKQKAEAEEALRQREQEAAAKREKEQEAKAQKIFKAEQKAKKKKQKAEKKRQKAEQKKVIDARKKKLRKVGGKKYKDLEKLARMVFSTFWCFPLNVRTAHNQSFLVESLRIFKWWEKVVISITLLSGAGFFLGIIPGIPLACFGVLPPIAVILCIFLGLLSFMFIGSLCGDKVFKDEVFCKKNYLRLGTGLPDSAENFLPSKAIDVLENVLDIDELPLFVVFKSNYLGRQIEGSESYLVGFDKVSESYWVFSSWIEEDLLK